MEVVVAQKRDAAGLVLVVHAHPFLTSSVGAAIVALDCSKETLGQLLGRHQINDRWGVEIDGIEVPFAMWNFTRVKAGRTIECRPLVFDGDIVRTFAIVVLSYYTFGAAGMGAATNASFMGMTGAAGWAAAGVAFYAGVQIINQVLPPPTTAVRASGGASNSPTYSLSGGRNALRPWQPMALVLGEPYAVPDLASQSYTRYRSEDQYLTMVFHLGINCHGITQLKIGDTSLSTYSGVTLRRYGLGGNVEIDSGLPSNNVDTVAGALLDAPDTQGAWTLRTTSINCMRIEIDIEMSLFSIDSKSGDYRDNTVQLDMQYSTAGSGVWIDLGRKTYSNATTKPLRITVSQDALKGQYDVRLRKVTPNSNGSTSQNVVTWTQLKSFQIDLSSYPGQSLLSMTIKSSGQLNGSIDTFNCIAKAAPHQYWDGTAWTTATSRANGLSNPGALILLIARGIYDEKTNLVAGMGWPADMIDIETLKSFMVWCAAKNFTFDAFIQEPISTIDLLSAIAYAGLGTIDFPGGKLSVRWLTDTSPIESVIAMGNIKSRSFNVSWTTSDRADEIEYGYFDRGKSNKWTSLRVTAPGVTMPRNVARLSNMGITTQPHAAVLARHTMAQNLYTSKTISLEMDWEYLTVRRGTVVALSHDMTQWGYSGRLRGATIANAVVTLSLDDQVPAYIGDSGSANRYIGLRPLGESQFRVFRVEPLTDPSYTVTLADPWPAGIDVPVDTAADCLWIYDFKSSPGLRALVTSLEPDDAGKARVTLAPIHDEFWPYVWTGAYAAPPVRRLPDLTIQTKNSRISEMLKRQGSVWAVELTVIFDVSDGVDRVEVWAFVGDDFSDDTDATRLGETRSRSFTWPVTQGETWWVQLKPFDRFGRVGAIDSIESYTVEGMSLYPSNVQDLTLKIESSGIRAQWSAPVDLDYSATILRVGESWDTSKELLRKNATSHLLPFQSSGTLVVWAAHVDTSNNVSLDPVSAVLFIAAPAKVTFTRIDAHVNTVAVGWSDALTAQPIKSYAIYTAEGSATFADATLYGKAGSDSRSDIVIFRSSGSKRIFMTAEDVAGNISAPVSVDVSISLPTDFVLSRQWDSDWSGTKIDAVLKDDGYLYLPIANEQWGDAPSVNTYTTTQALVDASMLYEFEPVATSGSYCEEHDIGKVLGGTTITVSMQSAAVVGTVVPSVLIEWRDDPSKNWQAGPLGVVSVQTNACRYVRVTCSVAAVNTLVRLQSMQIEVSSEQKTEFTQIELNAADVNGTAYTTTKGFSDVVSAVFTPFRAAVDGDTAIVRWNVYIDDADSPDVSASVYVMAWDAQAQRVSGKGSLQIGGY